MQRVDKRFKTNDFIEAEIETYLNDIRKYKVMTREREQVLSKIMNKKPTELQRKQVNQEMFEGTLRFVLLVAIRYQGKNVDIRDLLQEGNLALIKALESFDWSRKIRFTSYAVWWLRQAMIQFITENSRTVRLPANKITKSKEIKNMEDEMEEILADNPNLSFTSLDSGVMLEVMSDDKIPSPDDTVEFDRDQLKKALLQKVEKLKLQEKFVLVRWYGLDRKFPMAAEDIADELELSTEAVRQIKNRALRRIKKHCKDLAEFVYD